MDVIVSDSLRIQKHLRQQSELRVPDGAQGLNLAVVALYARGRGRPVEEGGGRRN